MNNPIYRDLIPYIDIVKDGDEYLDENSNKWLIITTFGSTGMIYQSYQAKCRRLNIRATIINNILNEL